jgi:hypothetical protein
VKPAMVFAIEVNKSFFQLSASEKISLPSVISSDCRRIVDLRATKKPFMVQGRREHSFMVRVRTMAILGMC